MGPPRFRSSLAALAAFAALAVAGPSPAAATSVPAVGYAQFKGCPHPGQNPSIVTCFREVVSAGTLRMGNVDIPITNPLVLSGGMTATGEFDANSSGGILPNEQKVPGGIIGFTGFTWLAEVLSPADLALFAEIETAGPPGDQLTEPATLRLRAHMDHPVLGPNCYIGSVGSPITLQRITGTTSPPPPNKPITGKAGNASSTGSGIEHLEEAAYVDNAFAAPGANGCVLTLFEFIPISIDTPINEQQALPSAAGSNEARQNFETEFVAAGTVYP